MLLEQIDVSQARASFCVRWVLEPLSGFAACVHDDAVRVLPSASEIFRMGPWARILLLPPAIDLGSCRRELRQLTACGRLQMKIFRRI